MTTFADYEKLLSSHDWTYMYSDDGSVYRRGGEENDTLRRIARESPAHQAFYDAWRLYAFDNSASRVRPTCPPEPAA